MLDEANDTVNPSQIKNCQPLQIFMVYIYVCISFITTPVYVHMHTKNEYKGLYKPPQNYPLSNTISMLRNKTWDCSSFVALEPGEGKGNAELSAGMPTCLM